MVDMSIAVTEAVRQFWQRRDEQVRKQATAHARPLTGIDKTASEA